jgi:deoxyribonuclease IV
MYNLGLKLWSTNKNYISETIRLYNQKNYQYMELFVVPGSYEQYITLWDNLNIPYILHAPHSAVGLNLAKKENFNKNKILIEETLKFAGKLNPKFIIFHPGIDGDTKETVNQLNGFEKMFGLSKYNPLIENKPYFTLDGDLICNGNSPEEIEFIMQNTGIGFCLDLGHAIYSANAKRIEPFGYLAKFNNLKPKMYHISDGDFYDVCDEHKNLGDGNFDIKKILKFVPRNGFISIETQKKSKDNLYDFESDIEIIKSCITNE